MPSKLLGMAAKVVDLWLREYWSWNSTMVRKVRERRIFISSG
jgi:hypothetical protein